MTEQIKGESITTKKYKGPNSNNDTYSNMDKSQKHYIEGERPGAQEYMMYKRRQNRAETQKWEHGCFFRNDINFKRKRGLWDSNVTGILSLAMATRKKKPPEFIK